MRIIDCINELKLELAKNDKLDSGFLDNRILYQIINEQRAIFIKNELNKGRSIEDNIKQTINGLKLIPVEASTFAPVSSNIRLLRTELKIPKTIELHHKDLITIVRNSSMSSIKYNYIHRDKFSFSGNGRFNTKDIYCTLYGGHIWIKLKKENPKISLLTYISVEGVFEDPRLVYYLSNNGRYESYYGSTGKNDVFAEEYPLSLAMWTYIKGTIINMELQLLTNIKGINTINNNDVV